MRGRGSIGLLAGLAALASTHAAQAGAWSPPKGQGEVIVKYENIRAEEFYAADGDRVDLPGGRRDIEASVFVEYGLTDRLTLQAKGEWQDGRDAFLDYQGLGPIEMGVRWQAYRDDRNVAAVYVGYAEGGAGRNAGYAPPGAGDSDWEVRLLAGRSFERAFVDLQAARRWRDGLPDEVRADATAGVHINRDWMVMVQAFGGAADDDGGARWLSLEGSVVRQFGDWRLQAGWRHAAAGREIPAGRGPVIGIWRRF